MVEVELIMWPLINNGFGIVICFVCACVCVRCLVIYTSVAVTQWFQIFSQGSTFGHSISFRFFLKFHRVGIETHGIIRSSHWLTFQKVN